MKILNFLTVLFFLFIISCAPVKVACIGDSITYGSGIKGRDSLAYPQQLQLKLGKKYEVINFGVSGATMLKKGNKPYWKTKEYKNAIDFNPKIIVLMLGTNDSKPINWNSGNNNFEKDYNDMISKFQELKSNPTIYLGLPPPVVKNRWGIQKIIVEEKVTNLIKKIARTHNLKTIDYYNIFNDKLELLPDNIHPNAKGAKLIAITTFSKIR